MIPSPTLFGDDNATWRLICPFGVERLETNEAMWPSRLSKERGCVCV